MTDDSSKLAAGLKEKVVGNVEKQCGKLLGSEHLKEKGHAHQVHGDKKLEAANEGIGISHHHHHDEEKKHHQHHHDQHHSDIKKQKHLKTEEGAHHHHHHHEGEARTGTVADVVTTKGETIRGETKVYEHVHPVTVVEDTKIQREAKPKKKEVHVVQHIEPIKEKEVHRHIEPVEVVHKKEVVHPKEEVIVHEHLHPVQVTEVHEHVKPEVHSLERRDVYPDAVVKEKHKEFEAKEVSREKIHRERDVKDLGVDIKTVGMREQHKMVAGGELKHVETHHEKHESKDASESGKKKKGKKQKHHQSDVGKGKASKTSETAPKV